MQIRHLDNFVLIKIGKLKIKIKKLDRSNKIYLVNEKGEKKEVKKIKGLNVVFEGVNNKIIIHTPKLNFVESVIICGNNTNIEIKSSKRIAKKLNIYANGNNNTCSIGKNFSCTDECYLLLYREKNLSINIGDDCMFGSHILLRTSDAHTITSTKTGEVINHGKSINIGNHVWLGYGVTILKGVSIADNCIIGTNSVVTKSCTDNNSIYVGSPAKKVQTDVNWHREAIDKYIEKANI